MSITGCAMTPYLSSNVSTSASARSVWLVSSASACPITADHKPPNVISVVARRIGATRPRRRDVVDLRGLAAPAVNARTGAKLELVTLPCQTKLHKASLNCCSLHSCGMISPVFGLMSGSEVSFHARLAASISLRAWNAPPESSAVRIASGMVASEAFDVVPCSTPLNNIESAG